MSTDKICNNPFEHRKALKSAEAQLVLGLAELQLKYLFHVLREKQETDFDRALQGYTSIVTQMRTLPAFAAENPDWQNTLQTVKKLYAELSGSQNGTLFARKALEILGPSLSRSALTPEPDYEWFGCFRYNYLEEQKHIALHFRNACCPESPFAVPADRVRELTLLIKDIQNKGLSPQTVGCDSWLNELKIFQSFFPEEYVQSFTVSPPDSKSGYGWWGQFIGKNGCLNEAKVKVFERNMEFPYRRLIARCPYDSFRRHITRR
ncbi:MAG: hypothetical protein WCS27_10000 [Victivallaceae bacterium]